MGDVGIHFMAIWFILEPFVYFMDIWYTYFYVLVYCTKTNLATLRVPSHSFRGYNYSRVRMYVKHYVIADGEKFLSTFFLDLNKQCCLPAN
jgi:hypothetical protein